MYEGASNNGKWIAYIKTEGIKLSDRQVRLIRISWNLITPKM